MHMVKVIALEGLDSAIIGTCSRDGKNEVLVYNADVARVLLKKTGLTDDEATDVVEGHRFLEHGDDAPIFVHVNNGIAANVEYEDTGQLH